MNNLQLIYAPDPIFSKKAEEISEVNDEIKTLIANMFEVLEVEHAVGLGANMVGVLKRIIVVNYKKENHKYAMVNPVITKASDETQKFKEASLCFPGIEADITRPKEITVEYLDELGKKQTLTASGFLSSIIQHEMDYLDGITFLDHLSKLKREMLTKKMLKFIKNHPPHIHGEHCNH